MSETDPSWVVKDFNVLYRVTRDLLLAVGQGDQTKTAGALDAVAAQLTRLQPAFAMTEAIRLAEQIASGFGATKEDFARAFERVDEERRKGEG